MPDFFEDPHSTPHASPPGGSEGTGDRFDPGEGRPGGGLEPVVPSLPDPSWQQSGLNIRGVTIRNLNAVTPSELSRLQQQVRMNEELGTDFNQLETLIRADMMRRDKTSSFDQAIIKEQNRGLAGDLGESVSNRAQDFEYYPLGLSPSRADIIGLIGRIRSRLIPLTAADTGIRSYKMVTDVKPHFFYATDINKLTLDKLRLWRGIKANADNEIRERGLQVFESKQALPTGSDYTGAPTRPVLAEPKSLPAPPFHVKLKRGTTLKDSRWMDDTGHWWYYDPDVASYVKFGGP